LQQRRRSEGIAEGRRPERILFLDRILGERFHFRCAPGGQQRILVIADIGVRAEVIAIGIDAALMVHIAGQIVDRFGASGHRNELEVVGVLPRADQVGHIRLRRRAGKKRKA